MSSDHAAEAAPESSRDAGVLGHCGRNRYDNLRRKNTKRWVLLRYQGWRCAYCLRGFTKVKGHEMGLEAATIDHVIPRSLGGSKNSWNCVIACRACNGAKGDKLWTPEIESGFVRAESGRSVARVVDIVGPPGKTVYFRCRGDDPLVAEAIRTPGWSAKPGQKLG